MSFEMFMHLAFRIIAMLAVAVPIAVHGEIVDTPHEWRVSHPGGGVMSVPRAGWSRSADLPHADAAVHHELINALSAMHLSIRIDRIGCFTKMRCHEIALNVFNPSAMPVTSQTVGPFLVSQFGSKRSDVPMFEAHTIATAYVDGVWFEARLTRRGSQPPDFAGMLEFVRLIELK